MAIKPKAKDNFCATTNILFYIISKILLSNICMSLVEFSTVLNFGTLNKGALVLPLTTGALVLPLTTSWCVWPCHPY
jgi:hypothetical protein